MFFGATNGTETPDAQISAATGQVLMTLLNGGNVGIGTSNPDQRLQVVGNAHISGVADISDGLSAWLRLTHDASSNYIQSGNSTFAGNASLYLTGPNGAAGSVLAMMFGNVGIRTATPQYALDVTGTIRGDNVTPSDRSLKKNIEPLPADTLSRVCKINGVSFEWDRQKIDGFPRTSQIGLIAQDVEKVFPSLVETDAKGVKSIHYMGVTAVLLEAVKTQQKQIKELKDRVRALEETRAGARAARVRPTQQQGGRSTIGIDRFQVEASGA